jgi:hypothetical protein
MPAHSPEAVVSGTLWQAAAGPQDGFAGRFGEHRVGLHVLDGDLGDVGRGQRAGRAVLPDVVEEVDEVVGESGVLLHPQTAAPSVGHLHVSHARVDDGEGLGEHGAQDRAPVAALDPARPVEGQPGFGAAGAAGEPHGVPRVRSRGGQQGDGQGAQLDVVLLGGALEQRERALGVRQCVPFPQHALGLGDERVGVQPGPQMADLFAQPLQLRAVTVLVWS